MKLYNILTGAMIAALMSSCSDYLDVKPYGRVVPKTAEEFSALLNSDLDAIDQGQTNYLIPNLSHTATTLDAEFSDNFEVCLTSNSDGVVSRLRSYVGDAISNNSTNSIYSGLYEVVRNCNIVLNEMEERGTEESDKMLALAHAMRGVAYYQLMRYFCGVPEPGNTSSQLGVPLVEVFDMEATPARSTLAQTITFIENDLKMALSIHMTDGVYRFTDDVVSGYLCRLYFWTQQWDKALPLAQEVLRKYPLLSGSDYVDMMKSFGPLKGNQMIKAYRSSSSDQTTEGTLTTMSTRPVSVRLLNCYYGDEKSRDVRYDLCFNSRRQAKSKVFCGMRAAEFALIEAECYYHLDKPTEALASINRLRSMRIADYTDLKMNELPGILDTEIITEDVTGESLTPLMALILNERRKELFIEGDRFFELKRNGAPEFASFNNGVKYVTRSYMYTFPIPIREFDITGNLVQNPGYTEVITK